MLQLFRRTKLSKSERLAAKEYERSSNAKFLFALLVFPLLLFAYNLNFEVKMNAILAKFSQVDETDSLSTFDRLIINRKAKALKDKTSIGLEFYITRYSVQDLDVEPQNLYLEINILNKSVDVKLPFNNPSIQARLENNLQTCMQYDKLGYCISNTIEKLNNIITNPPTPSTAKEYTSDFIRE